MLRLNTPVSIAKSSYVIDKMIGVKKVGSQFKTLCVLKSKDEFFSGRRGLVPKKIQRWITGSMYPDGTMFIYDNYLPLKKGENNEWFFWNDINYSWEKFSEEKAQKLNDRYDPVFEQVSSNKIKSLSALLDEGLLLSA